MRHIFFSNSEISVLQVFPSSEISVLQVFPSSEISALQVFFQQCDFSFTGFFPTVRFQLYGAVAMYLTELGRG